MRLSRNHGGDLLFKAVVWSQNPCLFISKLIDYLVLRTKSSLTGFFNRRYPVRSSERLRFTNASKSLPNLCLPPPNHHDNVLPVS